MRQTDAHAPTPNAVKMAAHSPPWSASGSDVVITMMTRDCGIDTAVLALHITFYQLALFAVIFITLLNLYQVFWHENFSLAITLPICLLAKFAL